MNICISVIIICFVFRISSFEFVNLFILGVLCPVEYPFHRSVILSFTALFHGASPPEYRINQDRVVCPKRYSTGESHRLSDSPNPNLTENFKYLWTVFVYHEAHEDHEEFTIKLYRPLRFKPRGRNNLISFFTGLTMRWHIRYNTNADLYAK